MLMPTAHALGTPTRTLQPVRADQGLACIVVTRRTTRHLTTNTDAVSWPDKLLMLFPCSNKHVIVSRSSFDANGSNIRILST